jgi:putative DNA primase/helicase
MRTVQEIEKSFHPRIIARNRALIAEYLLLPKNDPRVKMEFCITHNGTQEYLDALLEEINPSVKPNGDIDWVYRLRKENMSIDEEYEELGPNEVDFEAEEKADQEREREKKRAKNSSIDGKFRSEIKVTADNLPDVIRQIDQALIEIDAPIYQRGGTLVRIGEAAATRPLLGMTNPPGIEFIPIVADDLVVMLSQIICWIRYDGRSHQDVNINCPLGVARTYLSQRGRWKVPTVHAIITAPTLREDGTILDQPGLDKTGIYYDPRGVSFPTIPQRPTQADARAALNQILDSVREVPFVIEDGGTSMSRSIFFSAVLTGLIRASLPTAPLHAFSAPAAGSGKSILVNYVAYLMTGNVACIIAQGQTEEETEKRLGTALRYGDQIVSIDNCTQPIEGEFLCQAVTEPLLGLRILGKSERQKIANTALYTATGNNLVVVADMVRRTLRCTIDPNHEHPEDRTFTTPRPDLLAATKRAELVVAGLTVLRAYWCAGRPAQATPLGSLEGWSMTVRDCLIWLGEADPCESIKITREEDPERLKVATLLRQWHEVIGSEPIRVDDLIEKVYERKPVRMTMGMAQTATNVGAFENPGLLDALTAVCDNGIGRLDKQGVGNWLRGQKNKITDGYQVLKGTAHNGYPRWRVSRFENK